MVSDTQRLAKVPSLKGRVRFLYEAHSGFRIAMAAFDVALVLFFLTTTFLPSRGWIVTADYVFGILLMVDLSARAWVARDKVRFAMNVWFAIDIVVIFSLLAPMLFANYGFLRVLRAVRLLRAYTALRTLRRQSRWVAARGETLLAVVNLLVFVFVVSAFVYVTQVGENDKITSYLNAVYFTMATLTTTGFGDITLVGAHGQLLSVIMMMLGFGLFARLFQALIRPHKAHVECPACGLSRHDFDAVHCKHCGGIVHIDNEGR